MQGLVRAQAQLVKDLPLGEPIDEAGLNTACAASSRIDSSLRR